MTASLGAGGDERRPASHFASPRPKLLQTSEGSNGGSQHSTMLRASNLRVGLGGNQLKKTNAAPPPSMQGMETSPVVLEWNTE